MKHTEEVLQVWLTKQIMKQRKFLPKEVSVISICNKYTYVVVSVKTFDTGRTSIHMKMQDEKMKNQICEAIELKELKKNTRWGHVHFFKNYK